MRNLSSRLLGMGMMINHKSFALLACVRCDEYCFYPIAPYFHEGPKLFGGADRNGAGEEGRWLCCFCLRPIIQARPCVVCRNRK